MTLGSTQPLTEMNTRDIAWRDKGGLTPIVYKLYDPQPPGALKTYPGL